MTTDNGLSAAVAATLSGERVAARMTYAQLAASTDIPVRTLKRYLTGEQELKLGTLAVIAEALGLTLGEVVTSAERRRLRAAERPTQDVG